MRHLLLKLSIWAFMVFVVPMQKSARVMAFTQPKGVEFRYKSTFPDVLDLSAIEDETVRNIMLQRTKEDCKLYTLTVFGDKSLFTKDPASIVKMPLEVDYINIYMDFDQLIKKSQIKYHDQLYLVSDSLITDEWNICDTLDTIQGRTCYKATLKQNDRVRAWFDPEIAVNSAPFGYTGLPGLVVRMELPFTYLELQSIHTIEGDVRLAAPEKGTKMDNKSFMKMTNSNFKEFMKSHKKD